MTTVTAQLHAGNVNEVSLKRHVQDRIDAIEEWLASNDGQVWQSAQDGFMVVAGLRASAQQLRREMVVATPNPSAND